MRNFRKRDEIMLDIIYVWEKRKDLQTTWRNSVVHSPGTWKSHCLRCLRMWARKLSYYYISFFLREFGVCPHICKWAKFFQLEKDQGWDHWVQFYLQSCVQQWQLTKNFAMGCTFMVSDFIKNWWNTFLINPCLGVIYEYQRARFIKWIRDYCSFWL